MQEKAEVAEDRAVLDYRVRVEADLVRIETLDEGILGFGRHTGRSVAVDGPPDGELGRLAVALYDEAARDQAEAMAAAGIEEDAVPIRSRPEVVERLGSIPKDATDEEITALANEVIDEFGPEEVETYGWDLMTAGLRAKARRDTQ